MKLTDAEIDKIRSMNDQGYKPGNIDTEGLLDTIADLKGQLAGVDALISGAYLACANRAKTEGEAWMRVHQGERNKAAQDASENIENGIIGMLPYAARLALEERDRRVVSVLAALVEHFHAYENDWLGAGLWRNRIGLKIDLAEAEQVLAAHRAAVQEKLRMDL